MVFKEITILDVDWTHIEETGSADGVLVPYVLSDTPPAEWKQYFERHAPAKTPVVGHTVRFICPYDKEAFQRYGTCWNAVADLVNDVNRYYLGLELRRWQELGRQAEKKFKKGAEEEESREFETEWGRYMSRD